jgi:hypothetical protein
MVEAPVVAQESGVVRRGFCSVLQGLHGDRLDGAPSVWILLMVYAAFIFHFFQLGGSASLLSSLIGTWSYTSLEASTPSALKLYCEYDFYPYRMQASLTDTAGTLY